MIGRFGRSWVVGIFGDGTFGSLEGQHRGCDHRRSSVPQKMETAWAAGARVGYLVAPNVLSYVNGGYTGTYWIGQHLAELLYAAPRRASTLTASIRNGWFVGGGVENNLNILRINAPGWFMKTEYRAAYLRPQAACSERVDGTNAADWPATSPSSRCVQTISTSLVYRFNWGGAPIAAKY